jgi:hypothetical protein
MSNAQATRNGILALQQALAGVKRAQSDVLGTGENLSAGYRGGDGHAYQNLLTQWNGHCEVILKSLQDMINELENTGTQKARLQQANQDAINQANAAYTQLV